METETKELKSEQVYHFVKAKVGDFLIPKENPFVNDKLDRKKNAEVLTSAAFAYQDGAVLYYCANPFKVCLAFSPAISICSFSKLKSASLFHLSCS